MRATRHVNGLVGADHVALGSDFDGTVKTAFDASGMAFLTQALLESGFIEGDIREIMGDNVFRLLGETLQFVSTAVAEKLSALMTEEYLDERAKRGSRKKYEEALSRVPDVDSDERDSL